MRFVPGHSVLCERSREWISLRLDGELSELAEKMLESHLARCAACHYPLERWPLTADEMRRPSARATGSTGGT